MINKKIIKQQNTQQFGTRTGMISIQPKQMQTRAKSIAKRVQTKKNSINNFSKKLKAKIINNNFANKTQKNQENAKKISRNPCYYYQRLKPNKKAPQKRQKTATELLGKEQ